MITLLINGKERLLANMEQGASLVDVASALGIRADRVAIAQNDEIIQRVHWNSASVRSGDRLEIVHFVGGGIPS